MTDLQKLQIRASEIRQRLGELNTVSEPTTEQSAELDALGGEYVKLEPRIRAALITSGETEASAPAPVDAEERERRELRGRARVGDFVAAALSGDPLDGASKEYRDSRNLRGICVPLDLFEPLAGSPAAASEARASTPAPSVTPIMAAPTQPYVYARGAANYLGIDLIPVGPGAHAFPYLSTGTPKSFKAKGAAADSTAAAITSASVTPKRCTGSFEIRVEDIAVFPELEDVLRRDLPAAVADDLDRGVVAGNGTDPNPSGLLAELTSETAATTVEDWTAAAKRPAAAVDGLHAQSARDVRFLLGLQTHTLLSGLFASNTAVSAVDYLNQISGGVRTAPTGWIAAMDGTNKRQAGLARLGMRPRAACVALWGGLTLVRDEYSESQKGIVRITAHQLASDVTVLYAAAFKELSFKLAT